MLTKCIFQTQNKQSISKAEDYDEDYLSKQLNADFIGDGDVDMADIEKIKDFDFVPKGG